MRTVYLKIFEAFPDIHVEIEKLMADGSQVVVEWRFTGTMKGTFAGQAPTGRTFSLHGCEIFEVTKGKIRHQRGYWDKATMLAQLGIP